MIEIIKQIIKNYLNNESLANMVFGVVTSTTPLKIQVDKLIIPESKIIKSNVLDKLNIKLKNGDKVLLLKQQGGQLFYIMDIT